MYSFLCGCAKFQPLSASHWGETNQNWLKSNTHKNKYKEPNQIHLFQFISYFSLPLNPIQTI